MKIRVIGAGLAGCEAAWQIAQAGVQVELWEMKPQKYSPAHQQPGLCRADLFQLPQGGACGQRGRAAQRGNAAAGFPADAVCGSDAVSPRAGRSPLTGTPFSAAVTKAIREHPQIEVHSGEITEIPTDGVNVIATGPLTSDALAEKIAAALRREYLSFFDAAAPIVTAEGLDRDRIFAASRYGQGEDDAYLNCPMNKEEYERFYEALIHAERAPVHDFDVAGPEGLRGLYARRGDGAARTGYHALWPA